MIRKNKLYSRPVKIYEKARIEEENELVKKYGLKNKREIWKTLAKINYFRKRAMELAGASSEERDIFFGKLKNMGLKINSTTDVLGLQIEDLLKRRLPTIIQKQKMANTIRHARQMVVHKKIRIKGRVMNSPSYIVRVDEENEISVKIKSPKAQEKIIESPEAIAGGND